MLVSISNREDPDQTAISEAALSGSALFVCHFGKQLAFKIFRTFTVVRGIPIQIQEGPGLLT